MYNATVLLAWYNKLPQLAIQQAMWFLHDGMPVNFYHYVKWFFFLTPYQYRWIGLNGMVLWPLWLLNLTPANCCQGICMNNFRSMSVQDELKVFIGRNYGILPIPTYRAFSLTLSLFWNSVAPALTDARLPFIPVKVKRDQLLLFTCVINTCFF
jgi:hypothetical protein